MGVSAWYSSRDAAELLETESLRPDAGFILETQIGAIECWLEWDRGTETAEQVEIRITNAASEMEQWREYRYTLISGSMEEDIEKFRAVMRAERYLSRRFIHHAP
jgi:guanylate kinase